MIDLHCHLLPGLDDGAQSLEEALEMVKIAQRDGIRTIVATPHLFRSYFPHQDLGIIEEKRRELAQALSKENIPVEILAGAEVHISHNLIEEIKRNRNHLVLNQSSYMFVEFPADHVFSGTKKLFFELLSEGIIPIITHPERNSVFIRSPLLLYELIEMGSLAQANSGSFNGLYGRKIEESVFRLLEWNLIHFISSDGHNSRSRGPKLSEAVQQAESIIGKEKSRALVLDNPQAVLDDAELPYHPDPIDPRRKEKRLMIKIPRIFKEKK